MHSPLTELPPDVAASTLHQRERFHAAYSVLENAVADRAFPGAAFGIYREGHIIALDAVGRFTYDPDSPPVTPVTVFDLASVTKVVATTAAAMLLYQRGKLHLDQPVGEILPAFTGGPSPSPERSRVTLRHLLAHSSGLPAYARLFETHPTPASLWKACLEMPLEGQPGTRCEYSDIGFILLGKAIEVLCGEPLDVFCSREVNSPLGLYSTRYKPPPALRHLIPPTVNDISFRGRIIQGEVHDENCYVLGGVSGHAGLFSNALDALRFAAALLPADNIPRHPQLFHPETINVFSQRQLPSLHDSRALGWDTPSENSSSGHNFSQHSIGHLGYTGTSLWIDLEHDLAVVLLTNRTWPDRATQLIRSVRPAFHDAILAG